MRLLSLFFPPHKLTRFVPLKLALNVGFFLSRNIFDALEARQLGRKDSFCANTDNLEEVAGDAAGERTRERKRESIKQSWRRF